MENKIDWRLIVDNIKQNDASSTEFLLAELENLITHISSDLDIQQELRIKAIECAKNFKFNPNYNIVDYKDWLMNILRNINNSM